MKQHRKTLGRELQFLYYLCRDIDKHARQYQRSKLTLSPKGLDALRMKNNGCYEKIYAYAVKRDCSKTTLRTLKKYIEKHSAK